MVCQRTSHGPLLGLIRSGQGPALRHFELSQDLWPAE